MRAFIDNDHVVRFSGAKTTRLDTGEDVFLDAGAVVQFRIQTTDHVDVAGETWPQTMSYIAGSEGDFIGVLRRSVVIETDTTYLFIGTADYGVDSHAHWEDPLLVITRDIEE